MANITLHLSRSEWQQLTALVLNESSYAEKIEDKYMKALLYPMLKQVYIKLHNKLHSLNERKNSLRLTLPEASVLGSALLDLESESYLVLQITGLIDQKLT